MGHLMTRRYLLALAPAIALAALALGIPTDVLPNPWFTRMTPVRTLDLVLWPLTSIALGALLATAVLPASLRCRRDVSAAAGAGVLSVFAIGCPICNKLVVLALGLSGALTYFAPIQPVLGVSALALTAGVCALRVRALRGACSPAPLAASADG
jgi:hypothetical protein